MRWVGPYSFFSAYLMHKIPLYFDVVFFVVVVVAVEHDKSERVLLGSRAVVPDDRMIHYSRID